MKVDAKLLSGHLGVVSLNGRLSEVTFGPNFEVQAVDGSSEIVVKGKSSKVLFPSPFSVLDMADFVKLINAFNGEVNLDVEDGKVVVGSNIGVVRYQAADPSTIVSTIKNFDDVDANYMENTIVSAKVENSFPSNCAKFGRLISPDVAEFSMKDGKLSVSLVSMKGHKADLFVGEIESCSDEKFSFRVLFPVIKDVMSGFITTQSHNIGLKIGKALRMQLDDDYTFLLSPQAE